MATINVETQHGEAKRAVLKGLRAFNTQAMGGIDHAPLSITLRENSEIVGGVIGDTHLGWLFIQFLWIADQFRGKRMGERLLGAAEDEARRRGARSVYVDTFTFQAPNFYAKLGYREFGRLENYPDQHHRIWMTKAL